MPKFSKEALPRHTEAIPAYKSGQATLLEIDDDQIAELDLGGKGAGRVLREHLELIINTAVAGVVTIDLRTGAYEISEGVLRMLGYRTDEIEGTDFRLSTRIHPDDAARTVAARAACEKEGRLFERSYRLQRKDGSYIWVMGTAQTVLDDNGQPIFLAGVIRDISFSKRIEAELRAGEERYRAMFTASPMPMCLVDQHGSCILAANEAAHKLYDFGLGLLDGRRLSELAGPDDLEPFQKLFIDSGSDNMRSAQVRHRKSNGQYLQVECRVCPMGAGDRRTYVVLINDMTERFAAQAEIERLATLDTLTQLPNRLMLSRQLEQMLERCREVRTVGALLHINLDSFKALNESIGHDNADQVVIETARRLLQLTRDGDVVARVAGDEFVVVMQDLSRSANSAAAIAEGGAKRILESIRQPYHVNGVELLVTASIGLVEIDQNTESPEVLLHHANAAVQQAKSLGRNQVRFYDSSLQVLVQRRASLEMDLRRALKGNQFELYYQIQVDGQLQPIGAEVLLRWIHPERGLVSPLEFISLAEETGIIVPLGTWVLRQACKQLARWAHEPACCKLRLSVNVSARQFRQPDFVNLVRQALSESGARPDLLMLELTESMLHDHAEASIEKMNQIRRMGVGFSLDDFGTGYSSLAYLKRLPMDEVKIDRTFTRDVLTDPNDAVIVKTIIGMASNLGLNLIVEGVETSEQQALLTRWGCTGFQGFLHGRPVPIDEFKPHVPEAINASDAGS